MRGGKQKKSRVTCHADVADTSRGKRSSGVPQPKESQEKEKRLLRKGERTYSMELFNCNNWKRGKKRGTGRRTILSNQEDQPACGGKQRIGGVWGNACPQEEGARWAPHGNCAEPTAFRFVIEGSDPPIAGILDCPNAWKKKRDVPHLPLRILEKKREPQKSVRTGVKKGSRSKKEGKRAASCRKNYGPLF